MGRLLWADQVKGVGIILMIYAHNFPAIEDYIYTFHMPLFFVMAGMFHPSNFNKAAIQRRAKAILIPYFFWSSVLFLFWWAFGRHYGSSIDMNLSATNNIIGIFYAQGDNAYMNWGIPMWFLPCIFLTFLCFGYIKKIESFKWQVVLLLLCVSIGFTYPLLTEFKLPWSIDVALVALSFYAVGFYLKPLLINAKAKISLPAVCIIVVTFLLLLYVDPIKVDMYRSTYGMPILFIAKGLLGTMTVILFAIYIKLPKFLGYLGKHTITLLVLHIRVLTFVKFIALIFGVTLVIHSELEKIVFTVLQIVLIVPAIVLISRYAPILDGKIKK